ncbi:MAG: hypothetical protein IPH76_10640 [Xanthomonadales bacterium]|nr:hypothetical protein [Xanthomonadales bacterium]
MKDATAWIVVASTACLIGDPGPHPMRRFRSSALSARGLAALGELQRCGGPFEQVFSVVDDQIRFHVVGSADYLVHAMAKQLGSPRGAHLGQWFEKLVARELATHARGWRVGRRAISAPKSPGSAKYDADLVLVDDARQRAGVRPGRAFEFPQFPYLADVLATCVVGDEPRNHGAIARAYFQLDGIRSHLQEPACATRLLGRSASA